MKKDGEILLEKARGTGKSKSKRLVAKEMIKISTNELIDERTAVEDLLK